jgi:flagellar basal body-associated protein FliL
VDKLVYLLPTLGCAAMMGAMMWMMRGHHASPPARPDAATQAEIAALRSELATLKAAQPDAAGRLEDQPSHAGPAPTR